MGEFILPGTPLASVWPMVAVGDDVVQGVRQAFVLGPERRLQHDVELGIQRLVDIAPRALSPGINDPTTAINCIDRLAEILIALGQRAQPTAARQARSGRVCLIARGSAFEDLARLSFEPIEHYGATDPVVARHLLATLGPIAAAVPSWHRAVLAELRRALPHVARQATDEPSRRGRLELVAARVLGQVSDDPGAAATRAEQRLRDGCRPACPADQRGGRSIPPRSARFSWSRG